MFNSTNLSTPPRFEYTDLSLTLSEMGVDGFFNEARVTFQNTPGVILRVMGSDGNASAQVNVNGAGVVILSPPNPDDGLGLGQNNIFVGNAGGFATGVAMSGDMTIDETGVTTLTTPADVSGPSGATDLALAAYDGTTGKLIQNTGTLLTELGPNIHPTLNLGATQVSAAFVLGGGITLGSGGNLGHTRAHTVTSSLWTIKAPTGSELTLNVTAASTLDITGTNVINGVTIAPAMTGITSVTSAGTLILDGPTGVAVQGSSLQVNSAQGLQVGTPSGAVPGFGNINASAMYDDGVLLTDYIFEIHFDGKAIDKEHVEYKIKTLEEEHEFVREHKHLSTIRGRKNWDKNVGKLLTDLWKTVETQALYIFELNERLTSLEGNS